MTRSLFPSSPPLRLLSTLLRLRHLRPASRLFTFVEPPSPPLPASTNGEGEDPEEGMEAEDAEGEEGADDDLSDFVDRSPSARLLLFSTLSHLLSTPPATVDPSYVDVCVSSLEGHAPLLPREVAKVAEVWMHAGREEEAVKWVRRLVTEGRGVECSEVEQLRDKAGHMGMKALEKRLNDLVTVLRPPQPNSQPRQHQQSLTSTS